MTSNGRTIPAVVLAGGLNRIMLYDGYMPGYKGLLPVRGRRLIEYTLDALKKTDTVERICIVGPVREIRAAIADPGQYEFEDDGETLIDNIRNGLSHFSEHPLVLVTTADLPLATADAITAFLRSCAGIETSSPSEIFWSMVPEQDFIDAFTQVRKGFNRFRDISVCHGNLLLISPALAHNHKFTSRLERIYSSRKSSVRAAMAVGTRAALSYLFGVRLLKVLTINQYARIVSARFGVGVVPVILHHPGIAVDIDEARDYRFIMEELHRRELNSHSGCAAKRAA